MSRATWDMLESHTNAAEQAHAKGYRTGLRHKLLVGIRLYVESVLNRFTTNFTQRYADGPTGHAGIQDPRKAWCQAQIKAKFKPE